MESRASTQADRILDKLEAKHGIDRTLRGRIRPVVVSILQMGPSSPERTELLKLVVETYAHQAKVRRAIDDLKNRLRRKLNEVYGRMLGIEPPNTA